MTFARSEITAVTTATANSASPWLTVEQAADRAQVSKRTIYNEVKAGRLRAARIGGRRELRFRAEFVDHWLDQSSMPQEIR